MMSSHEREIIAEGVAPMDALIGQTIGGRYVVTGRLARGGMACVYTATQTQLSRQVAIKVMRSTITADKPSSDDFRRRFLREASILSRLQHPNLVTLIDYGQITELEGDHYFIAMEYLQGETLGRRFRTQGRLSAAESIRIARQIGRGLRETHRQGIIHRDLKPSNIMLVPEVDEGDIVKLIDFGIGKVIEPGGPSALAPDEEEMTRVGLLLGSPRYMAPEQIRGEPVEPRTDLYGLGTILFQSLTGHVPFQGKNEMDTLLAQCTLPPPPLEAYLDDATPESLSELVADLLKKRASERPTVHEFLQRLADVERDLFGGVGLAGNTLTGTRRSLLPERPPSVPPRPDTTTSGTLVMQPPPKPGDSQAPTRAEGFAASPAPQSVFDLASGLPQGEAALPPTSESPRRRMALRLLVVAVFGVFLWLVLRAGPPAPPVARPTPSVAAPAALPATTAFMLHLDSEPLGAVVTEQGVTLGQTPLDVPIERESVANAPRRFTLEHRDYLPFTVEQSDSEANVTALGRLQPVAAKAPASRGARRVGPAPSAVVPSTDRPAAAPARPGLEINLDR